MDQLTALSMPRWQKMKDSCMQSRFNTSAQITPELDVIPRGSIEAGSGVSSPGDLSLPKIGLAVSAGKVHLAVPSQLHKNRKKKGTTLIARFVLLQREHLKAPRMHTFRNKMRMRAVVGARERLKVSFWTVPIGFGGQFGVDL